MKSSQPQQPSKTIDRSDDVKVKNVCSAGGNVKRKTRHQLGEGIRNTYNISRAFKELQVRKRQINPKAKCAKDLNKHLSQESKIIGEMQIRYYISVPPDWQRRGSRQEWEATGILTHRL